VIAKRFSRPPKETSAVIAAFLCLVLFVVPDEGAGCSSCAGVSATDFVSDYGPGRGALAGRVLIRFVRAGCEDRLASSDSKDDP
jgi:hypothetical protein